MRKGKCVLCVLVVLMLVAAEDKARAWRFTKAAEGKVPKGWKVDKTGMGEGTSWKVLADATAPSGAGYVLAQVGKSPNAVFNLCVAEGTSYQNLELKVAFKANEGELDRGGGLVWRYQDHDNYYITRMNPLEDNFRVYKVINGKREQLGTVENIKVESGAWHTIHVTHVGKKIVCSLDAKPLLEVEDAAIEKAGAVGLWTKADARSSFDDLTVGTAGK
jgi:hypothetical protein